MSIETENYHTVIKTLPAEEFPLIPVIENKQSIVIDGQELKKSLDQVSFAASTNQTQPEISGILFNLENSLLKIAATDRYRLAEKTLKLPQSQFQAQIIIPHKTIMEFSRVISGQKGNAELSFTETQISFKFNNTEIISRLVDGQYPDYKQIIPEKFYTDIVTEKQPMVSALKASGIFSQTTHSVKLDYLEDRQVLVLNTESQELGKSQVELSSQIKGKSGTVVLNYHYMLDCLSVLDGEKVVMKIVDDSTASLLVPQGQDDYFYLVMPIKS
jgi:DNA polymerase-3 subunit beta